MLDPLTGGRRLALRQLAMQAAAVAMAALVALALTDALHALAVTWGGSAVLAGQAIFAWLQFRQLGSASLMLRRFFGAAAWKWVLLFAVFGTGLVLLALPAGALLAGLITAQLAGMWALLRYG